MERMNTQKASDYLGLSYWTLVKWRQLGKGPVWMKLGSRVRYSKDALDAFIEECAQS